MLHRWEQRCDEIMPVDNSEQKLCRFHGWCKQQGLIKGDCSIKKCKICNKYTKFERDLKNVRMGDYRDRLM